MRKDSIHNVGSEQCCTNRVLKRNGAKTNSNTGCYTNSDSNSNLNNRRDDVLRPMVNKNEIECSIPCLSIETNTNNHSNSNFNNRPDNSPLSNNYEIEHFIQGPSKESDKKANTEIMKQLQRNLKIC